MPAKMCRVGQVRHSAALESGVAGSFAATEMRVDVAVVAAAFVNENDAAGASAAFEARQRFCPDLSSVETR